MRAVVGAAVVALLLATIPVGTSVAAAVAPVTVPLRQGATELQLLSLSSDAALVYRQPIRWEAGLDAGIEAEPSFWSGKLGGSLVRSSVLSTAVENGSFSLTGLNGSTQAWTLNRQGVPTTELHRTDLVTGVDTLDGVVPRVAAADFNGTSWIAVPKRNRKTKRLKVLDYPLSGAPGDATGSWAGRRTVLTLPVGTWAVCLDADTDAVLMITARPEPGDDSSSARRSVDLFDLATGAGRTLADGADVDPDAGRAQLGATTVIWQGGYGNGGSVVWSVPRSGGQVGFHYMASAPGNPHRFSDAAVTDDGRIGYIADRNGWDSPAQRGSMLRILDGDTQRDVRVPERSGGLIADGNDFYTAIGGTTDDAGIYRIDDSAARGNTRTRVSVLPAAHRALRGWTFQHGTITLAQRGSRRRLQILQRSVTSTPRALRLGAEQDPQVTAAPGAWDASFAGGRLTLVSAEPGGRSWRVGDGSPAEGVVLNPVLLSGQAVRPQVDAGRVLLGGQVFDAGTGALLLSEPQAARQSGQDTLVGRILVYSGAIDGFAEIVRVDLKNPLARVQMAALNCDHAPEVAASASLVAWAGCNRRSVTVHDVKAGWTRVFDTGQTGRRAADGIDIVLDKGSDLVGWVRNGRAALADLDTPDAPAILLDGPTRAMAVDDDLVVREVPRDDPWAPYGLIVQAAPTVR